jgi:hypothetical protein
MPWRMKKPNQGLFCVCVAWNRKVEPPDRCTTNRTDSPPLYTFILLRGEPGRTRESQMEGADGEDEATTNQAAHQAGISRVETVQTLQTRIRQTPSATAHTTRSISIESHTPLFLHPPPSTSWNEPLKALTPL